MSLERPILPTTDKGLDSWEAQLREVLDNYIYRLSESLTTASPPGTVVPFAGNEIPSGWLLCDGAEYDRVKYPSLFRAITDTWGAPSGTTFNVPNLQGKLLYGVDGSYDLADSGPSASIAAGISTVAIYYIIKV